MTVGEFGTGGGGTRELRIPHDHPAFAGHFPGLPILPGAVLLDEALETIAGSRGLDLTQWQVAAKFLEPVRPGDILTLEFSVTNGPIRFSIRRAGIITVTGTLTAARRGTADGD